VTCVPPRRPVCEREPAAVGGHGGPGGPTTDLRPLAHSHPRARTHLPGL